MKHEKLIRQMTLAEKCALLSGKDVWHTRPVERLNIPSVALSDGPSGLRKQEGEGDQLGLNASVKATCFPSAAAIANSWNPDLAERVGECIGAEARAQNVQVLLGPGLNTKRSPLCGRNFEYFSEDPYLSGKLAAGFIRGVQKNGVAACPKHFAANSQEGHRMASDSVVDERTLRELYLTNFEIAVREGGAKAMMSSYNLVNGIYANENPHLLQEILRKEWGFEGAVVTDWGGSNDFTEGARVGMNLEMPGAGDDSPIQLMKAVKSGRISVETVDQRVDELLELILTTDAARKPGSFDADAHHDSARRAALEAIVLLKNEDAILPLDSHKRVAVIGDFADVPRYQGAGSSQVNPTRVDNTVSLRKYYPNAVSYTPGFTRADQPDAALTNAAIQAASGAECVLLYLGLTEGFETEGLDRTHLRIPQNQIDLLEKISMVNPNIVVVLSAGSAVETPWADKCKALVYGCLGGQAGAEAMLQVLTGEYNPGGKLAETFPSELADLPVSEYYPGAQKTAEYREGLYVGYRYFVTAGKPARFPFGFGLSYTNFQYANLTVSETEASFDLTNTGDRAGDEVAQLYVSLRNGKVFRPLRELKGFSRVCLQPGETRRVTIPLDDKAFRYWNVKTNRWEIEEGTYEIQIASSSTDIRLTGLLPMAGTNAPCPYEDKAFEPWRTANLHGVTDTSFRALLGRPIPPHSWDESALLGMNDAIMQLYYAKNPAARWIGKLLRSMIDQSIRAGKPDLNMLFIYNMPFRGIAKMMNGMVSMEMAEGILNMANGHFFKGLAKTVGGFFHRPSLKHYKEDE